MIIGIDFDDTWTVDPGLWGAFALCAQRRGHRILIVTQRSDIYELELRALLTQPLEIVFCAGHTKEDGCAKLGIKVDVWIDDYPAAVQHEARAYRGYQCEPTIR